MYLQRRLLDQGCSLEEIKQDYPLLRMSFPPHGIAKGWRSFERKKIVHPLFKISVWASSAQKEPIEKNFLKIIDFGLSCKYTNGQVLQTKANFSEKRVARSIMSCMCHHDIMFYQFCHGPFLTTGLCRTSWSLLALLISILKFDALKAGTPYYVAPQVLQGKYDQVGNRDWTLLPSIHLTPPEAQAADLWSCGVLFCMFTLVSPCQAKLFWIFENAHHRTDLLVCKGKETLAQDSRTKRYWDTSRFCIETQDDTRTYKNTSNKWCAMCTTCRDHGPIIAMMRVLKSSLVLRSQKHPEEFSKDFGPGHHVRSPLWISSFLRWFRCRGSGKGLGHPVSNPHLSGVKKQVNRYTKM